MAYDTIQQATMDGSLSDGTAAACFLSGIETGLFSDELPKEWAFKVIEMREKPPVEIIEVATAKRQSDLCEALEEVRGHRDLQLAGCILLRHIYVELHADRMSVGVAAYSAERITRTMSFPDQVYFNFMALHNGLNLAQQGVYRTVSGITEDLLSSLRSSTESTFG